MSEKIKSLGVIIFFALLVVGCVPARFTKTPDVSSKIIDRQTMAPIEGATIYFMEYPENTVSSDKDGLFQLDKNKEWGYFILLGAFDPLPPLGILIVEAEGYKQKQIDVQGWVNAIPLIELEKENE